VQLDVGVGWCVLDKAIRIVIVLFWSLLVAVSAQSANIKVMPELSSNDLTSIAVVGDIERGDANAFLSLALNAKTALVFLASDGGDAAEGLLLAKAINRLGYGTAVIDEFRCISACALIWIGGKTRFLSKKAIVGFHAVYTESGVSSDGNAIYGAFYGQLGLSDRAIRFLTSAPPQGYNQVTLDTAPLLDISVRIWDFEKENQPSAGEAVLFAEQGVAVSGFDMPNATVKNSDKAGCLRLCENNASCRAFTYDIKASTCYQKDGGRVLFPNEFAYSGAKRDVNEKLLRSTIRVLRATDIKGNDLQNFKADHVEACLYGCQLDSDCHAFTYSKKKKTCWLKSSDKPRTYDNNFMSGVK
jgi:PAN domain